MNMPFSKRKPTLLLRCHSLYKREDQLSQRDRATHCVQKLKVDIAPFERAHMSSYMPSILPVFRFLHRFEMYSEILVEIRQL